MARDLSSEDPLKQQKARAQRIDHDYHKKSHPWRSKMKLLSWGAPILGMGALVAFLVIPSGAEIFTPGPVSTKHAMFSNRCGDCHESSNGQWGAVLDTKCMVCHDGPLHSARQVYSNVQPTAVFETKMVDGKETVVKTMKDIGAPRCATCHQEHRGSQRLADISDHHCTQCHGDLKVSDSGSLKSDPHIYSFASGHPDWDALKAPDPTKVNFNHSAHMKDTVKKEDGSVLGCTDCHRPDKQRAYMIPIKYEAHCASCHPLAIPPKDKNSAAIPIPHGKPERAAAAIGGIYSKMLIDAGGKVPAQVVENPDYVPAKPGRPAKGQKFIEKAYEGPPLKWLEEQTSSALKPLFEPNERQKSSSCMYCHFSEGMDEATKLPKIIDPKIPSVWLTRSSFNHETHRVVNCQSCHTTAGTSSKTEDVLLPNIQNCQACHSAKGGARSGCNECHIYHDKQHPRIEGILSLEDLLSDRFTGPSKAKPAAAPAAPAAPSAAAPAGEAPAAPAPAAPAAEPKAEEKK